MEMKPDEEPEIAKINKDAMMPTAKRFTFDLDELTFEGGEVDETLK